MFGSDSFPLGPGGKFPKQRIGTSGNVLPSVEEVYENANSRLPVVEKDFNSSIRNVQNRLMQGRSLEGESEGLGFFKRHKNRMFRRLTSD